MNKWSIKRKLVMLSTSLIMLTLIVAAVGYYGVFTVARVMNDISHIDLPSVHSADDIDMMHDGLRSVVYRAMYLSDKDDEQARKETADELKEMSARMKDEFAKLEKIDISPEVRKLQEEVRPKVIAYTSSADEIVTLALAGKRSAAEEKVAEFQAAFEELEKSLGAFGDQIKKEAHEGDDEGVAVAAHSQNIMAALVLGGLIFGFLFSAMIIRQLMNDLGEVVGRLTSSSRALTSSSSDSASSATELSEAATEQAASLQETMASVEEISAMVTQNAESANKVKAAVETNQQASEDGSQSVGEMIRAIGEIKDTNDKILNQMEVSNTEFGEIVKIISEIGEKTKVINDIVFQTKLLSFNASVEAARAGEHGKGFAVVAEEVGNLAQMSGNAAKQITEMLSDSIKKVNTIVEQTTHRVDQLVEVGKDKITMGQSTAQKCKEALEKIADNARTVTSMVAEITHASKEQAQGIHEINKAISQLDQVTQQNATVAQRSSTQAEALSAEAQQLSHAVTTLVQLAGVNIEMKGAAYVQAASTAPVVEPTRESPAASNVIAFDQNRRKATKSAAEPVAAMKNAVGATPSSNDPGFEEF